jgi:cysteine-rich repeat protein
MNANGKLNRGENCDDGNDNNEEACTTECQRARCGDKFTQLINGETCGDGNNIAGDGCSSICLNE